MKTKNDIPKKQIKRTCFDCGEDINDETIETYPDTEICLCCLTEE